MTPVFASQFRLPLCRCALLISILLPLSALADNWQLQVGAQNGNRGHSGTCFLFQRDMDSLRRQHHLGVS